MNERTAKDFQSTVWNYYRLAGRHDLPWRQPEPGGRFDPYRIMVSELMLQQTQVSRVIPKYQSFLQQFPTLEALAAAPLGEVLRVWNGLGYNRRAKFLHQAAQVITHEHNGRFPTTQAALQNLPGIGPNTAGAILVYAYNQPLAFVETNIRTIFIHHFFEDRMDVADREVLKLVVQTLDHERPREWYWALMDYGSHLKQSVGNLNRQSRGYSKQSRFEGSLRQIRGQVIRSLSTKAMRPAELQREIADERLDGVLADLLREGLIRRRGRLLSL